MFRLEKIVRKNILDLVPYASARDEFKGVASVFLDANENSYGSPISEQYSRYPDPLQEKLKERIIEKEFPGMKTGNLFLGNGSDEAIDLLFRIFCEPGKDNAIVCPPTYGMYSVSASVNDVKLKNAPLTPDFNLDLHVVQNCIDEHTKLIFLCSPNNPTGNDLNREDMISLCRSFHGIVVADEAYITFSSQDSLLSDLRSLPNLVVLRTFSKAWGLAGIRLGMALASEEIITLFNKVKPPYNINSVTQEKAAAALESGNRVGDSVKLILAQREFLRNELKKMAMVDRVFPSSANFLLVRFKKDAAMIYEKLKNEGVIVRNRSNVILCEGCLRITIGTNEENQTLIKILNQLAN